METQKIVSIIAIILGAVGLFFPPFILSFAAIIMGFYAYSKDEILGIVGLLIGTAGIILFALMFLGIIPLFYGIFGDIYL